tara:strand:- start:1316 stop:2224 length:909 start_codon:yes stop_codon:yes gene_type:complete
MKKILVTGGAGFIGTNLIEELLTKYKKEQITVLDNHFTSSNKNHIEGIKYIYGNTWDIDEIFRPIGKFKTKFDIVFHFGEFSRIVRSFEDIEYVIDTNLTGTAKVLQMCSKWNAKFIYSASSSKFGNEGKDENLSPYAWCKAKMVELIKNFNKWYDLQYEICYFFNVYGENQIVEGNYKAVIAIFEEQYNSEKPMTIVNPGTQTRHFTYVKDIVKGVIKTIDINMNHEWFFQNEKEYSILEVAKLFHQQDNYYNQEIVIIPSRKGERFNSMIINNDTRKILNWKPEYELHQWINKVRINGTK